MATNVVSWTTVSLMLTALPQIASKSSITSAEMYTFAGRAESLMRSKLARRYTLPFSETYEPLETIATDIALYFLLTRRVFTQERENNSEGPDRFKEGMEQLDQIAEGGLSLVDSGGAVVAERTDDIEMWSSTSGYEPTMTEDSQSNQLIDPDKIDDIQDERDL